MKLYPEIFSCTAMPKVATRWRYTQASGQWLLPSPWFITVEWRQSIKKLVKEILTAPGKRGEREALTAFTGA